MPRISVVLPTYRVGGLDLFFQGLAQQTFRDFELVIVDGLYERRKAAVAEQVGKYSFPVKHVPPWNNRFPLNGFSHACNVGIANASGEIVVLAGDYLWMHPTNLEVHARRHDAYPRRAVLGRAEGGWIVEPTTYDHNKYGRTKLDHGGDEITIHQHARCELYVADLKAGLLDQYMWSTFDVSQPHVRGPHIDQYLAEHPESASSFTGMRESSAQWCNLKNESVSMEVLLKINGLDEAFDGSHGWQDTEFAERVNQHIEGWDFVPEACARLFDQHYYVSVRWNNRHWRSNEGTLFANRAKGYPPVNPSYSLRERRAQALGR